MIVGRVAAKLDLMKLVSRTFAIWNPHCRVETDWWVPALRFQVANDVGKVVHDHIGVLPDAER